LSTLKCYIFAVADQGRQKKWNKIVAVAFGGGDLQAATAAKCESFTLDCPQIEQREPGPVRDENN